MIANENIQDQALENFKADKTEVTVFVFKRLSNERCY